MEVHLKLSNSEMCKLVVRERRDREREGGRERFLGQIFNVLVDLLPTEDDRNAKCVFFYSRTVFCVAPPRKCGLKPINQLRIDHVGSQ